MRPIAVDQQSRTPIQFTQEFISLLLRQDVGVFLIASPSTDLRQ